MGKIRIKTLGADELEEEQKKRDEERRAKKRAKKQKEPVEKVQAEDEKAKGKDTKKQSEPEKETGKTIEETSAAKEKVSKKETVSGEKLPPNKRPTIRSERYKSLQSKVDKSKYYPMAEALKLVKETANTKFDGSIEAHFNLTKKPKELKLKKDKTLPISYERKFPLAHAKVGKTSQSEDVLQKQIDEMIKKIGARNITKLTLSSTMGPGVKTSFK